MLPMADQPHHRMLYSDMSRDQQDAFLVEIRERRDAVRVEVTRRRRLAQTIDEDRYRKKWEKLLKVLDAQAAKIEALLVKFEETVRQSQATELEVFGKLLDKEDGNG